MIFFRQNFDQFFLQHEALTLDGGDDFAHVLVSFRLDGKEGRLLQLLERIFGKFVAVVDNLKLSIQNGNICALVEVVHGEAVDLCFLKEAALGLEALHLDLTAFEVVRELVPALQIRLDVVPFYEE